MGSVRFFIVVLCTGFFSLIAIVNSEISGQIQLEQKCPSTTVNSEISGQIQLEQKCPSTTRSPRKCLLRTNTFDQQIWNYAAGFYCYNYTNEVRFSFKYNFTAYGIKCRNETVNLPVAIVNSYTYAFFDYTNQTSMAFIRKSFKTDALFNNFLKCCREASDCCDNHMTECNIIPNTTHCPTIWDAWSCFPQTKVNTTTRLPCSSQAYQSPDDVCTLESEKLCMWNANVGGVWEQQTDYTVCAIAPVYKRRHEFHVIFLAICIVFCLPAITIFMIFDKLRKTTRVILHRNLLIAICVRNVLTILSKELVLLDALKSVADSNHVMDRNSVECRTLAFLETSAKNSIYACMLLDGFYLHKVIVRAFAKEIKLVYIYVVLVGLTFLPSLGWATAMGIKQADNCWMVDAYSFQWIIDGIRIAILCINTIFLVDIIRVMILKLKHGSTTRQTKAAFRATMFLIPLFGIHIIVTAKKIVVNDTCTAEDVYDYARYSMEALQGIAVAILFCYANSEVHNEIRNGYRKLTIYLYQKFGWNLRRETFNRRRTTAATYVQPYQ